MTDKNFKSFVGVFVFLVLAYEFEGKRMADPKDSEELSLEELAKAAGGAPFGGTVCPSFVDPVLSKRPKVVDEGIVTKQDKKNKQLGGETENLRSDNRF